MTSRYKPSTDSLHERTKIVDTKSHVVVGIGTGWKKGTLDQCNAISTLIAEKVDELAYEKGSQIFLVGGNGKNDKALFRGFSSCSSKALPEVLRMKMVIHKTSHDCVLTDCDENGYFTPSHNTPTNAINIAKFVEEYHKKSMDIVGLRMHLPRIIACTRKELFDRGLLNLVTMTGYPIDAEYEKDNGQFQLRSKLLFGMWNSFAGIEHILRGRVLQDEYLKMLMYKWW